MQGLTHLIAEEKMKTDTTLVGIRQRTVAYALKYLREYAESLENAENVVSQRMKRTMKELEEIQ